MNRAIVITTINYPTKALKTISKNCKKHNIPLYIIGDRKTPKDFSLDYGNYFDLTQQAKLFPKFSKALPINHYCRKNIGYLLAYSKGFELIQETDDDNIPLDSFWEEIEPLISVRRIESNRENNWCNIFRYYTDEHIWPRGFPLEEINSPCDSPIGELTKTDEWSIINGLANDNPDVDAIYRLTSKLPITFSNFSNTYLEPGLWAPFNSQNTVFKREVSELMYLPSYCSFRMTDIWRSFIAQRCLWEKNQGLVFTQPTVFQERNEHNLIRDFEDEIPGYLKNNKIIAILSQLSLSQNMGDNLHKCYSALVKDHIFPEKELRLVDSWLNSYK